MPKKYLRKGSVAARYDRHVRWVERAVKEGVLPRPYYLGGTRFPMWAEDELDAADRAATRKRTSASTAA